MTDEKELEKQTVLQCVQRLRVLATANPESASALVMRAAAHLLEATDRDLAVAKAQIEKLEERRYEDGRQYHAEHQGSTDRIEELEAALRDVGTCPRCDGRKTMPFVLGSPEMVPCRECHGTGLLERARKALDGE